MGASTSVQRFLPLPAPEPPYRRPRRIVLIRHGQSMGNVDSTIYTRIPDWRVELTVQGKQQAIAAGQQLQQLREKDDEPGPVFIYTSPYVRCTQTLEKVIEGAELSAQDILAIRDEPRLREQDFGNFQDTTKIKECKDVRTHFGRFFYRFPCGESGADVYDRVSNWFDTFYRDLDFSGVITNNTTIVIITHGLTSRLFLMRYYHWSVQVFEQLVNPPNAQLLVMERDNTVPNGSYFALTQSSKDALNVPECAQEESEYKRQITISRNMAEAGRHRAYASH